VSVEESSYELLVHTVRRDVVAARALLLERGSELVGWGIGQFQLEASPQETAMLYWAFVFLVIGLVAALFGFTGVAGASFGIAKFLAGLFLVVFLILLIVGMGAARRV
jgi:uncharacterized membrane protein YtjA (UPF0391 family)